MVLVNGSRNSLVRIDHTGALLNYVDTANGQAFQHLESDGETVYAILTYEKGGKPLQRLVSLSLDRTSIRAKTLTELTGHDKTALWQSLNSPLQPAGIMTDMAPTALWYVHQPEQSHGGAGGADPHALHPRSRRAVDEPDPQGTHRRPAISDGRKLMCARGGQISVQFAGQTGVQIHLLERGYLLWQNICLPAYTWRNLIPASRPWRVSGQALPGSSA